MYFIDSSALVKAYVTEQGTATVQAVVSRLGSAVCVSTVVVLETAAALARLRRTKQIRSRVYARARKDFLYDCRMRFHVVHPPEPVVTAALGMIDTYWMRSPGAADLLHIATAEYVQTLLPSVTVGVMCCDLSLRSVAEERGLDVFDPIRDPLPPALQPPERSDGETLAQDE